MSKEYKILMGHGWKKPEALEELTKQISEHLADGWEPHAHQQFEKGLQSLPGCMGMVTATQAMLAERGRKDE